jgi:DNA polymerase III delta prime subunit
MEVEEMGSVNTLLLTGAPGVGKSTLAEEMFDQLAARHVRHAVIDVDALCMSYPFRPGDHFNNLTALENVRSVWHNFADQGIERLILVRVVERAEDVQALIDVVPGAAVVVCQLVAGPTTVEQRLRRREVGSSTDSLVARGRKLAMADAGEGIADVVVQTEALPIQQVALDLLRTVAWLPTVDDESD